MPARGSGFSPLNLPTKAVSAKVINGSIKRAPAAGMAKSKILLPVEGSFLFSVSWSFVVECNDDDDDDDTRGSS